ncbi:SDR family oxidoreductase [Burkholderia catarinensis]|uniref:SDR family oxidoreductase n=1 Tax=Burkholderia catarinensis TaxID=1108140 RepID=UPI0010086433|nr:SDR family oxidoreductase [Burkholderia catarinensis]KAG8148511.1 short-chain dehydrogenase [Burkholderia catarinensis]
MRSDVVRADSNLKGTKIVVVGGSSGIGYAVTAAAAIAGARVIIASRQVVRIKDALATLPPGVDGEAVDFTNENDVAAFFKRTGQLDHLVYTAGEALLLEPLSVVTTERARKAFDVRYWGAFTAVKHAAPRIPANGSITLTSGIASSRPTDNWSVPASILGAIEALTRALAIELAPIRVNAVAPGVLRTPMWNALTASNRNNLYESIAHKVPVGRVGEAVDVARTYLYLMQQGFSTGQISVVDGGHVLV